MSLAKPETNDDGQLPTGWHLLTCWHFTAGRFNCRTSAALRFSAVVRDNRDFTKAFPSFIIADSDEDNCVFGNGRHRQFVWADGWQVVWNGFD